MRKTLKIWLRTLGFKCTKYKWTRIKAIFRNYRIQISKQNKIVKTSTITSLKVKFYFKMLWIKHHSLRFSLIITLKGRWSTNYAHNRSNQSNNRILNSNFFFIKNFQRLTRNIKVIWVWIVSNQKTLNTFILRNLRMMALSVLLQKGYWLRIKGSKWELVISLFRWSNWIHCGIWLLQKDWWGREVHLD